MSAARSGDESNGDAARNMYICTRGRRTKLQISSNGHGRAKSCVAAVPLLKSLTVAHPTGTCTHPQHGAGLAALPCVESVGAVCGCVRSKEAVMPASLEHGHPSFGQPSLCNAAAPALAPLFITQLAGSSDAASRSAGSSSAAAVQQVSAPVRRTSLSMRVQRSRHLLQPMERLCGL